MKKLTVLYVDDDNYSLKLLKEQLKLADIDVIMVNNGIDGLNSYRLHKSEINLVLIDVNMPIVNGYDLLHDIREENHDIPIIMITATSFIDNKMDIINMGATDLLIKPIPCTKMINKVKQYA